MEVQMELFTVDATAIQYTGRGPEVKGVCFNCGGLRYITVPLPPRFDGSWVWSRLEPCLDCQPKKAGE